jgi:hypothetical protein
MIRDHFALVVSGLLFVLGIVLLWSRRERNRYDKDRSEERGGE